LKFRIGPDGVRFVMVAEQKRADAVELRASQLA
jgi:hypothetical protein